MPVYSITLQYTDLSLSYFFQQGWEGDVWPPIHMYWRKAPHVHSGGFHSVHRCNRTSVKSSLLAKWCIYSNQGGLLKQTNKPQTTQLQIFKLVYGYITVHFLMQRFDWYCYYCLHLHRDKWVLPRIVIVLFLNWNIELLWIFPLPQRKVLVVSLVSLFFFFFRL